MTRDNIIELLRAEPFEPFRVHISSGGSYDVSHPELAMVTGNLMLVAVEPKSEGDPSFARLSLLHITHAEPLKNGAGRSQA